VELDKARQPQRAKSRIIIGDKRLIVQIGAPTIPGGQHN
jgi:hypothetical protein